eukprot:10653965-Alexandrium_andersonii.AAC.1
MSASLVGSEMCIRDRVEQPRCQKSALALSTPRFVLHAAQVIGLAKDKDPANLWYHDCWPVWRSQEVTTVTGCLRS